ncbi:MAG: ABC transporter permease subunit [Akkermansia sp.]|nr:ABC transporter permease subunit [Akkermansia sp.]
MMKKCVHIVTILIAFLVLLAGVGTTAAEGRGIASIDDLEGKKLAVPSSTVQDIYIQKHYPNLELQRYNLEADMMQALQNERCDAAIMDDIICYALARKFDNVTILKNSPVPENHMAVVFNKEQKELHRQFNEFLKGLRESGELETICDNWIHRFETTPMPKLNIPTEGEPIRVGMEPCTEPTVFVRNGEIVGLDAELIMRFAAYIGRPVEIMSMDYDGLIPAAVSGKVDMASSGLLVTEERAESVLFSDPYYASGSCIAILTKNAAGNAPVVKDSKPEGKGITSIDDLAGKKLAVPSSTVQDIYLQKHYPHLELQRYNLEADMMQALQNERCDAAIMDDIICFALARKFDNVTILKNSPVPENHMAVVFNKEQSALCRQFNAFLKGLKDSGELETICDNWIHRFETTPMPKLNIPTEGEPIRVGMEPCTEPTVFVRNGEIVGLDAELIMRFAAHIGRPVEIMSMDYDGLIPAAVSGKVDMSASGLLVTEERAENVLFSDPYYASGSCIAVLTKNAGDVRSIAAGAPAAPQETRGFWAGIKRSFHRNIIAEKRYLLLWDGLKLTIYLSIWAALLGTVLGAGVCYLRMRKSPLLQRIAKTYIDLMRGTPILVLLLLMNYVVFANWKNGGTAVAIITFALNFAAYVSEMFRTAISSIDRGQTEAGIAMGFTPLRTFVYIVLPQAVQRVLPVYKGELISLIKTTSIVGYIAIQDLTKASDIIRGRTFDPFFPLIMAAVLYFLLAWIFGTGLDWIGRRFNASTTNDEEQP